MRVGLATEAHQDRVNTMTIILRAIIMDAARDKGSPVPYEPGDYSLWSHALTIVAGELVHECPREHRGVVVENLQQVLSHVAMRPL